MAEEERKRRRGRRRGRQDSPPPGRPDGQETTPEPIEDMDVYEESEAPPVTPSRFSFRRLSARIDRIRARKESHRGGEHVGDVSPMDFWRGGAARSHRGEVKPRGIGPESMWRRITGLYFPPWVPVAGIIVVVFGVLGLLFFTRSAAGAPRIGQHWHAPYQYWTCGEKQPNFPTWESGVHTHSDGIIHIHPFASYEEGSGSRLVNWFEYGGGKLDSDEVRAPGSNKTYKNGDPCGDGGVPGEVQVFVNGAKLNDYTRYIPQDGDQIRIVFGPSEEVIQLDDRTVLAEQQATRDVQLEVSGNEGSTAFSPPSVQVDSGETVRIVLKNASEVSHGLRIAGVDAEYETGDDFLVTPMGQDPEDSSGIIDAGQEGFVVVKFEASGEVEFYDTTVQTTTGKILVRRVDTAATPTPTPEPKEAVDAELNVATGEMFYDPVELSVGAGQKLRITIANQGQFLHNVRIAGPDGEFDTPDDIVSPDVPGGETKDFVAQIDTPGQYQIRCDYHRTEHSGMVTVE